MDTSDNDSLKRVSLPLAIDPRLLSIRSHFQQQYTQSFGQGTGKGLYSNHDWRRIQHCLNLISDRTGSILDVGAGPGVLLNYLHDSEAFDPVTGIDIRRYSKLILMEEDIDYRIMDATNMSFSNNAFDTVICMEMLEHMTEESMVGALGELRRVAGQMLLMSVPFEEPEPLPAWHKQRFTLRKIEHFFPEAEVQILCRPQNKGWPWAIMIERS